MTTNMRGSIQWYGMPKPCHHDCMMNMSIAIVCDATVELDASPSPVFYGHSDHAGTRAKRNKSTEVISAGLAMCCNDGWWNDAARQMQEEAPLENGRNVSR